MKMINPSSLKRDFQADPVRCQRDLCEWLDSGQIKPEQISIQDLFISLHENGEELFRSISYKKSGGRNLMEAVGAVDSSAFSNITGQLIFNKVKQGYQYPDLLWPELCTTMQTNFLDGERIPGVGEVGTNIEIIGEGEEFPSLGLNEDYTDTVPLQKRGFIVPVTREIIIRDRTGLILTRAANGGKWLGINKEFRVIDVATGQVNNYNRNGVASNTYLSSGAYINTSGSNALQDWTSVQTAALLFDAITDPNTGVPVVLPATQLIAPSALKQTAYYIQRATSVARVDNQANPTTYRTYSGNPAAEGFYGQPTFGVLSNAYVKSRTSSATKWFYGNYKEAVLYKEAWGIETLQAIDNNEQQFTRDIWQRYKVSEMGAAQMLEPRWCSSNN